MNKLQQFLSQPDFGLKLSAAGQALSQMDAGQPVNIGYAHQMLAQRRDQRAQQEKMQSLIEGAGFTPEEQSALASMPASVATQLIVDRMFPEPVRGVAMGNMLINPMTGEVMADFRQASGPDPTAAMREYAFAVEQGYGGTFEDWRMATNGGTTVNVMGDEQPSIGTIPQGFEVFMDETGQRRMRAIPGGPADTSPNEEAAQENTERSGGVVTEDIGRALDIIEENPGWTTGLGAALASVPGTQAKSLSGLLQTIGANVGFDRLQAMRDASPTGGALGAINQQEMGLLMSALGNLEQSLSAEDLTRNLTRLNRIYLETIHGKEAAAQIISGQEPAAIPDFGSMTLDELMSFDTSTIRTPEALEAWQRALQR